MQFSLTLDQAPILPRIRTRLLASCGPQRDSLRLDPVSQLVLAIISARTRDEVSLQAFERLARRYRPWSALGRAAPAAVEAIIRPVTYADVKAVHLPRALRLIEARTGSLDLAFLAIWPEEKGHALARRPARSRHEERGNDSQFQQAPQAHPFGGHAPAACR